MIRVELTLGGERTRPGPVQYSSDKVSAFVKYEVHPGDKFEDVLTAAHADLARALSGPPDQAPTPPPRRPGSWLVRVQGGKAADTRFSRAGFRYVDGDLIRECPNKDVADKAADGIRLLGDARLTVTVEPPPGGA